MGKSQRNTRGKQGHNGGGKRHSGGWVPGRSHAPPPPLPGHADSDSDGPGALHIGGVRIRVDAAGNGVATQAAPTAHRRQRRRGSVGSLPPRRDASSGGDGSGSDAESSGSDLLAGQDAAMRDYLANLAAGSDGEADGVASGSVSSGSAADVEGRGRGGGGSAAKRRRQVRQQRV